MGNNSVPLCNHKNTGLDNYNQNQNETSFLREEFRNKITIKNIIMIRGPSKDIKLSNKSFQKRLKPEKPKINCPKFNLVYVP